jgi:hypothetical protein
MDQRSNIQTKRADTQPAQMRRATSDERPTQPQIEKRKPSVWKLALAGIILLIVIGGIVCALNYKNNDSLTGVKESKYQALFLTNGQVYFGKLKRADHKTIKINNIFYLQVQQDVQPKPKDSEENASETQLIKLGGELHGPEDEMFIDRNQVLFWENLQDDSKVMQAIRQYKK